MDFYFIILFVVWKNHLQSYGERGVELNARSLFDARRSEASCELVRAWMKIDLVRAYTSRL